MLTSRALRPARERVVVTGLGVVAPGALGVGAFTDFLRRGESAVAFDPELARLGFGCQVSARPLLSERDLTGFLTPLETRRWRNAGTRYALYAGLEAFADAGLKAAAPDAAEERWSISFGTGLPGIDVLGQAINEVDAGRCKKLGSAMIEMQMPSSPSALLAAKLGAGGHVSTNAAACATGAEAVLLGAERIRRGQADFVLAGSAESEGPHLWGAFDSLQVLTRSSNQQPQLASRPLSSSAAGFVPASGAGALCLESLSHARARGAKIYCELRGGAVNCGGQRAGGSMTAQNPDAVRRCLARALADAEVEADEVDAISGHLTATRADPAEVEAWAHVLRRSGRAFPRINAPKSLFGHALSASGAIELVACVLQLEHRFLHRSANCEDLHPKVLTAIAAQAVVREVTPLGSLQVIAKSSFGFGDVNACVVLAQAFD